MARVPEVRDGKIQSAKCEVNIVEHCNLACRACSHLSPVLPRRDVAPAAIFRDLSALAPHYHARWIRLLGGEPLLHKDILGAIAAARRSALPDRIAVVTNGVLLPRMPAAFWEAVDGVEVCLYPGKELGPDELRACRRRAKAHGVRLMVLRIDRFRESYSEVGTDDPALVQRIYDSCTLVGCHTVADGVFYKCPPAYFLPKLLGGSHAPTDAGVRLDGEPDLRERLLDYLRDPEPLPTCQNCLGGAGRRFKHEQTARSEFRRLQSRPTEELVNRRYLRRPSRVRGGLVRLTPRYYREERRLS